MRFMPMDSDDGGEVLPPIPQNFMDIACAKVSRALGGVKRTSQQDSSSPDASKDLSETATKVAQTQQRALRPPFRPPSEADSKPTFFKDSVGNEYRMKNGRLYIKGWSDTNLKFRLLNATTGKELSLDNKKIQVYGWHVVEAVTNESEIEKEENSKVDEIERVEEEAKSDD